MGKKVVIIEDNPAHRELFSSIIQDEIPGVEIDLVENGGVGIRYLKENQPDLIILDYYLPKVDGLEFLRRSVELRKGIPLLMVTGSGNEKVASEAFKLGVTDYIVKDAEMTTRIGTIVKDILENHGKQEAPKANPSSSESAKRLVEGIEEEIIGKKKNKAVREKVMIEFSDVLSFNEFQRWIGDRTNIIVSAVKILENKYVLLLSVSPRAFSRIT